jgi:hypothetical protein
MPKDRKRDKVRNWIRLSSSSEKERNTLQPQYSHVSTELSTAIPPATSTTSVVGQNPTADTARVHTHSLRDPKALLSSKEHFGDTAIDASLESGSSGQCGPLETPGTGANNATPRTAATSITRPQPLWAEAVSKLDLRERATLKDFVEADHREVTPILDDIRNETQQIVNANREKAWKVTVMGKDVVLRDVGMRILQWVDKFKDIGDIAVQYDPGHAALPWALFRFLLQVGSNTQRPAIEQSI